MKLNPVSDLSLQIKDGEFVVLLGPTGAGKEGVARILGRARYIPFDEKTETFASRPSWLVSRSVPMTIVPTST